MDMNFLKGIGKTVAVLLLTTGFATANAASVSVSNVMDGNASSSLFDGTVTQSGAHGEILTLGLENFGAFGELFSVTAVDSVSMTITAPTGFVITSIGYEETGTATTTNGVASATGSMIADGIPKNFLTIFSFQGDGTNSWLIKPAPIAIDNKQSIALNVTNSLFAVAFNPAGGDIATIEKTSAFVTVGLTAIPIPPAIWMMGAAITALVTVGRRGGQAS